MKIKAISISDRKGTRKKNIASAHLLEDFGLKGDAHGGKWHRQVSFLAQESIDSMRIKGFDVVAGNFAENITTEGINLSDLAVGNHLQLGESEVIISQLGKICHRKCAIYHQAGDCVMPREGIFGVVHKGGRIVVGDTIALLPQSSATAAIVASKTAEREQGKILQKHMQELLSPAFIRFEHSAEDGSNIREIVHNLTDVQAIDNIVVFASKKNYLLAFDEYPKVTPDQPFFTRNNSRILCCTNVAELKQLS